MLYQRSDSSRRSAGSTLAPPSSLQWCTSYPSLTRPTSQQQFPMGKCPQMKRGAFNVGSLQLR